MFEHHLRITGSTRDLDRNRMRATLECDDCDLTVRIDRMVPISAAERFIADVIEFHRATADEGKP